MPIRLDDWLIVGVSLVALAGAGCGGGAVLPAADAAAGAADLMMRCPAPADGGMPWSLLATIHLTDDGQGVPFFAQNGSRVHVPKADIAGKTFFFATAGGGDQITNVMPIDIGGGTMSPDLSASLKTPAHYPNGPWEMAVFISITGGDPTKGPQPGDLAAFSLAKPPACEPPPTGVSIRMTVKDGDAMVAMDNSSFIRF